MPVIVLDPYLVEFYDLVNSYWLYNSTGRLDAVTMLSTGGGHRDVQVRDGHTLLDGVWQLVVMLITQDTHIGLRFILSDHLSI